MPSQISLVGSGEGLDGFMIIFSLPSGTGLGAMVSSKLRLIQSGGCRVAKHFAKTNIPRYFHEKLLRKAVRQKRKWLRAACKRKAWHNALFEQFGHRSKIMEMMANEKPNKNIARKGSIRFTIPPTFSIIDNPETTLVALSHIACQMHANRLSKVFLDFGSLSQYDLGANGLLDVLIEEQSTQSRRTNRKIRWQGTYPKEPGLRRFLQSMGVIKRLKIEHEYPTKEEENKLALFDTRCKHYIRALKPREADKKARVTQRFADHINKCLGSANKKLTEAARGRLCQYVGEIIDNAEEHAGMLDWSIQGYLDTNLPVPMCEIVIFNFGRTIAASLADLPMISYTQRQVHKYIELHTRNGHFQEDWRTDDLYTLIALQGNVSSKNNSPLDTRGNGTVDLIELFQRVYAECSEGCTEARMAIVSGSTYILFDGKYRMEQNSDGVGIIAFNDTNDLHQKPNSNYVRHLKKASFPGTIISFKFPLSSGATELMGEPL